MSATQGTSGFGTLLQRGDGGVGAGTKASKTIGTVNQALTVRSNVAGVAGNSKTFGIVVAGNSTAFSIVVTASSVLINSATDSGGVATTTVDHAIAQLYANSTFVANFEALTAGNGTGVLVAGASAALTGGAAGTETFTTIAEITNIAGPGRKLDLIDATHMESPSGYREYIPSLKDGQEVNIDLNYLPADTNQSGLATDFENRTKRNFRIIWTDTAASTDAFAAYVVSLTPTAKIDDKLMATASLKITGAISRL